MARESFVFYKSFLDAIEVLNDPLEREKCYSAIIRYGLLNEESDLEGFSKAIFVMAKPQLDANNKRYEDGKRGGRPKKEKTTGFENKKPLVSENAKNKKPNVNVNVNDNVNDNVNVNEGGTAQETHTLRPGQVLYGELQNVAMTSEERKKLDDTYQDSKKLVNKVSRWLPNAEKDFPDHYALCLTFAGNDNWPKKKKAEPVEEKPIEAEPMPEDMRASIYGRLGKAFD